MREVFANEMMEAGGRGYEQAFNAMLEMTKVDVATLEAAREGDEPR